MMVALIIIAIIIYAVTLALAIKFLGAGLSEEDMYISVPGLIFLVLPVVIYLLYGFMRG